MNFFEYWQKLPSCYTFDTPVGLIQMYPYLYDNGGRINLGYTNGEYSFSLYERIENDEELTEFIEDVVKKISKTENYKVSKIWSGSKTIEDYFIDENI